MTGVADQAEDTGLVLRHLRDGVGHHLDVNARQKARLAPVPAQHRLEVHRLAGRPCRHPKRAAADQRLRLGEPGILTCRGDDFLVDGPEGPQADLGQEVARALDERDRQCGVVDLVQACHHPALARRDRGVAGDDREQPRVIALSRGGSIPAVDEIAGRDGVAIRELRVSPDPKRVLEPVCRHGGLADRDVGDFAQLIVKPVEAGKDVAKDVDIGRGGDQGGIEIGDVLGDGKAERLVSGQRLG